MARSKMKFSRRQAAAMSTLRGLLFAIAVTLVMVLLLALLIGWTGMEDGVIRVLNQVVKLGAIAAGVCFASHRGDETAMRRGALIGLLYMALGVLLYALFSAQKLSVTEYLIDIFMGIAAGGLTGIIISAVKEKAV